MVQIHYWLPSLWKVNSAGLDSALKAEGVRKRMEFDSTILPPYYVPRYFSGRMSLLHGEGRQFDPVTRYQYPIGEMNITPCYERGVGSLILSLGARVRKMGRMVMRRIANP